MPDNVPKFYHTTFVWITSVNCWEYVFPSLDDSSKFFWRFLQSCKWRPCQFCQLSFLICQLSLFLCQLSGTTHQITKKKLKAIFKKQIIRRLSISNSSLIRCNTVCKFICFFLIDESLLYSLRSWCDGNRQRDWVVLSSMLPGCRQVLSARWKEDFSGQNVLWGLWNQTKRMSLSS